MIQKLDEKPDERLPVEGVSRNRRWTVANALYSLAQSDETQLDRRQKDSDRRNSDDQRSCFRFASSESDQDAYIVMREQHTSVDENAVAKESQIVDVAYNVVIKDHSSGGFGFLIDHETPLEVDHVIRLSTMGRMHLIRIRNIRPADEEGILIVGAEYIEDMMMEMQPELSVLELFVDRRQATGRLKGTIVVVLVVVLTWMGILGYALYLKAA